MSVELERDWRWLQGFYNGESISLVSGSGSGNFGPDDEGALHFLPANVSNRELGEAAHDTLAKSRFLFQKEWKHFFSNEEIKRRKHWLNNCLVLGMKKKSFSKLKPHLMLVELGKYDWDVITKEYSNKNNLVIYPTKNLPGKDWDNVDGGRASKEIIHDYPCPPAELGALLREAFKRCEGVGRDEIEFPEPLPD